MFLINIIIVLNSLVFEPKVSLNKSVAEKRDNNNCLCPFFQQAYDNNLKG